jgi:3-deoxy-7-phosphoheptulonate synthase
MGVTEQGLAAIVKSSGNKDVHVILRGGSKGPNYSADHVKAVSAALEKSRPQYRPSIMIDCSRTSPTKTDPAIPSHHLDTDGNSLKNHNNQPKVIDSICEQLIAGDRSITGVMIESNINAGRQDVPEDGGIDLLTWPAF